MNKKNVIYLCEELMWSFEKEPQHLVEIIKLKKIYECVINRIFLQGMNYV